MGTRPPLPELPDGIDEAWPAPEYRSGQKGIFQEAAAALYGDNKFDTVIIDAPTGLGKSVIDTGLCKLADSAFYTTPQKELRRQLENDDLVSDEFEVLRGRADYEPCWEVKNRNNKDYNCSSCPINNVRGDRFYHDELPSSNIEGVPKEEIPNTAETVTPVACPALDDCNYWNAKERAMDAQTAVVTFAYLIYDYFLDTHADDGIGVDEQSLNEDDIEIEGAELSPQISFANRDLLVVDEAHSLEGQVASMFAGFSVGEAIPHEIRSELASILPDSVTDPNSDTNIDDHVVDRDLSHDLGQIQEAIHFRITKEEQQMGRGVTEGPNIEIISDEEKSDILALIDRLETLQTSIRRHLRKDYNPDSNPWVVNAKPGEEAPIFTFQPVHVDEILKKYIWSRADKIVLSSATIPAYKGIDRKEGAKSWADRIGLNPETTHVICVDSPFPSSNRPIYANNPIGNMSNDGFERHLDDLAERIRELAEGHAGEKGLVHTSSYPQAKQLADKLGDLAICHERSDPSPKAVIKQWQGEIDTAETVDEDEERDILISPSLKEGVDLPDEKCQWQVAAKTPFPSLGDPRVRYRKEKLGESDWYFGEAAIPMVQAAGRGVRHKDDKCDFYVLDSSFSVIRDKTPRWYRDAIVD